MSDDTSGIRIGRGPRAVERALLAAIEHLCAEARATPALLAAPVRVVVPSQSLARHVGRAIVRRAGRGIAGVRVQTLHAVALEILDAAGVELARGDALLGVLVRGAAAGAPALQAALGALEDGYAAVIGAVSDLLDAGLDPDDPLQADALDDAITAAPVAPEIAARAREVVAVACAVSHWLAAHGLARRGTRLLRAAQLLADQPALLPARAVLVHGFADATGAASGLLESLFRRDSCTLFLDHPDDPGAPGAPDLGVAFTDRLAARATALAPVMDVSAPIAPPRARLLRASGTDAEVRAVADRVSALLERGVTPEDVAIVARDLAPYTAAIRTQLGRLGIAFSGHGAAAPPSGRARRVTALIELLRCGGETLAERWLETWGALSRERRDTLRLAFHTLGAATLSAVAELDVDARLGTHDALLLHRRTAAVARGAMPRDVDVDDRSEPPARAHRVARDLLCRAAERARSVRDHLERARSVRDHLERARSVRDHLERARSARDHLEGECSACDTSSEAPRATLEAHAAAWRTLRDVHLEWEDRELAAAMDAALAEVVEAVPEIELSHAEWLLILERCIEDVAGEPFGGAGAGVQVLSVVEARARTFSHLFVLGVCRDAFPRVITEDPLMPDAVRLSLAAVLPEMPVKWRGFEEEHYLFAQLVASSDAITLAWQVTDDDGRARSASPFVERIADTGMAIEHIDAPSLYEPPPAGQRALRTSHEAAIVEALRGSRARASELLREVVNDVTGALAHVASASSVGKIVEGRLAVLRELEARAAVPSLGPYLGRVGSWDRYAGVLGGSGGADGPGLYITHVERLVRCGWQYFVERLLGVGPLPDAAGDLPELAPALVGDVAHSVLEQIVRRSPTGHDHHGHEGASARAVPWPGERELDALVLEIAERRLADEGRSFPGFARVLADIVRPRIEFARTVDWPSPGSGIECVDVEATYLLAGERSIESLGGRAWSIRYRVDRVDRLADGALRYIDYKTGGAVLTSRAKARDALLRQVAAGAYLQAPTYARVAPTAEGRFVFLDAAARSTLFEVRGDDDEMLATYMGVMTAAVTALERGAFLPRLVDARGDVPRGCGYCEVREACLQGDSGARARLRAWAEQATAPSEGGTQDDLDAAARALFALRARATA
jgi:hypothetical protein